MSATLFDSISRIARHEAAARSIAAIGEVVDVFDGSGTPPDHAVSVRLRESGLLLPKVPIAVGVLGHAATPTSGELVVVVFADGEIAAPVVVGRLYHADLAPPVHADGDLVLALPAGSSDPTFSAVLRGGDPELTVSFGTDITLTADDQRLHIRTGDAEASIESSGGGRIELKIGDASVKLTGRGDVTLSTTGKLILQGAEVEIKGQSSVSISGPQVKVN